MADDDWDEKRIDIIGSNGNEALHYQELENNKMNEAISDPLDVASHNEQVNCDMRVKEIQAHANELEVQPVGHCLYCGEKFLTDSRMRFCDAFCRDGYEKEKSLKR
jgi:hypothetical protein